MILLALAALAGTLLLALRARTALLLPMPPGLEKLAFRNLSWCRRTTARSLHLRPCGRSLHRILPPTSGVNRGGPHNWADAQADIDNGKMAGFLIRSFSNFAPGSNCQPPDRTAPRGLTPARRDEFPTIGTFPNYWNLLRLDLLTPYN